MNKFSGSFTKYIKKEDYLVLAVSGGGDSMVLLDLVLRHHPKNKIIIAHFDHSLRGKESDEDREFVVNFCEENELTYELRKLDIANLAKDHKMSIENAARKYRYEFFDEIAKKHQAKYILTAHHADDRIETALFNLIRGTKLGGIHALSLLSFRHCERMWSNSEPESMDCHVDSSNLLWVTWAIFRPLLSFTKLEIQSYAEKNNIVFRDDSTNMDRNYQRNYLRHEVFPRFETINPEYRRALSNFIDYTEELKLWIDREVEKFLSGKNEFSAKEFEKQSPFLRKEIIRYLYEKSNSGTVGLSEGNINEILRFILSAEGWTRKEVHGLFLLKQHQVIFFSSAPFHLPKTTVVQDLWSQ